GAPSQERGGPAGHGEARGGGAQPADAELLDYPTGQPAGISLQEHANAVWPAEQHERDLGGAECVVSRRRKLLRNGLLTDAGTQEAVDRPSMKRICVKCHARSEIAIDDSHRG